jgi:hypothetical protein
LPPYNFTKDRQGQKFFIQAKREHIWEHHFWRSLLTRESTYTCMNPFFYASWVHSIYFGGISPFLMIISLWGMRWW